MEHEVIGTIEEMGSEVSGFRKGELVIVSFAHGDNTCPFCRSLREARHRLVPTWKNCCQTLPRSSQSINHTLMLLRIDIEENGSLDDRHADSSIR